MKEAAVDFADVDKLYRLGAERINLRAAIPGPIGRRVTSDAHAALRGLSLRVLPGETVGVVGRNGAGKSTLLKLVARVIAPTRGVVSTRGQVASLIELGAGFHPDLTGAENVRFAAVMLGMSSREVSRRYDEIVAFAGIERFMDTPVKRYSSGMLARLGFAVASHLDADILAVDEVLQVGDTEFQRKCHERVAELRRTGCAVLFVTHNTWIVPQVCQRAIWLERGAIVMEGDPEEVVTRYRHSTTEHEEVAESPGSAIQLESLDLSPRAISPGHQLDISVVARVAEPVDRARLILAVTRHDEFVCTGMVVPESESLFRRSGVHQIHGTVARLPLRPGDYRVWLGVVEDRLGPVLHSQATRYLEVLGEPLPSSTYGLIDIDAEWSTEGLAPRGAD